MKLRLQHIVLCAVALSISASQGVVVNDFARYEVILQRRPFGEAPSDDAELFRPPPPAQSGPSFADALTLCAITSGGGAIRVGFLDAKTQPPKTYFLFVGEREDGIEVVAADYEQETVTLTKDGDTRVLTMGGGGGAVAPAASDRASLRNAAFDRFRRTKITKTKEEIEEARRLEIERKSPILKGEEYKAHIRQYNMDLIRAGGDMGVPLPIALTPEEDAQLVDEGVLSPTAE